MNYQFCVITEVPPGNDAPLFMETASDPIMTPVFEVGELHIVCACHGREIGYPGRKPSKWDIQYMIFDDIEEAVAEARRAFQELVSKL